MKHLSALLLAAVMVTSPAFAESELQSWNTPTAQTLQSLKAPIRIVNLWATWCGPCRKEMPAMSAWYQAQKKGTVDLVGIALDSTENIGKFLKQTPVSYPIWRYAGNSSRNFMKSYGNDIGVLPFTVLEVPKCHYKQTITGEMNAKSLTMAVNAAKNKCQIK